MRTATIALCIVSSAVIGANSAYGVEGPAKPDGMAPYQMVRSLQLVQDRVAYGDHAALPIQRKLLEMIDARMRAATAAEMMQPQNFRSLMVYAMSGGNPATLTSVLFRLHLDDKENQIAGAVLAYLKGSSKFAASALKNLEPLQEPADIGAFLALVKGSVISLEDPKSALKLLDQARLLSPGTLVEEAALRRSIGLTATLNDAPRFSIAADQYARSYIRSPYASQFADAFVAGVVKLRDSIDLAKVDETVLLMSPDQQKVLYLRIARRAAIDGLVALSQYASERAKAVNVPGDDNVDPRILLYTSLTSVTTESADRLMEKIAGIDRSRLSAGDQELLDAVSAVSSEIVGKPKAAVVSEKAVLPSASSVNAAASAGADLPKTIDAPAAEVASAEPKPAESATAKPTHDEASNNVIAQPPTAQMSADAAASHAATTEADAMVTDGRKKLAEIDELLAGAAQ